MAIPDFQSIMLPLLRSLADGGERSTQETLDALAEKLGLSEADVTQPMPSRKAPLFTNRVAWAKLHLKRAGLLDSPRRGLYRITERGLELLRNPPATLNLAYLTRFPEYVEFRSRSRTATEADSEPDINQDAERTPEEYIEYGYGRLRAALADEILTRIAQMPPAFFEKLVVDLLVAMGYGGSQRDAGKAVGPGADEGLTASSRRTDSGSKLSTFRPSDGRRRLAALRSSVSRAHSKVSARGRASSSPPRTSARRPRRTRHRSKAPSFS